MEELKQGYSMPFAARRKRSILNCIINAILLVLLGLYFGGKITSGAAGEYRQMIIIIYVVMAMVLWIPMLARCLMWLHFTPEGVSVTLFGLRLRQFPTERIRLISGLKCSHKAGAVDLQIAVCDYSLEELTRLGGEKLLPYGDPPWEGAYAEKYLYRYGSSVIFREYNLHRNIFWFDWSPERLKMLQRMYPNAQWADCSEKKIFDEQLKS